MSLDTQDQHAREFCERLGFQIAGVARDTITGRVAPMDRKELGDWIKHRSHEFDAIVTYKTDRLSRGEDTDWSRIETWAADNRKTLIVVDANDGIRYPSRSDSDYWPWVAMKREAAREWHSIRERNVRSQTALTAKGSYQGRTPFGYIMTGETYARTLVSHPVEAPIVREIFDRTIKGESTRKVAQWVTEMTGQEWGSHRIRRTIENWIYTGRVERNGAQYMTVPGIVTVDELMRANAAMASRSKKDAGGRPSIVEASLLVPLCGVCQRKMYRSTSTMRYYHARADKYVTIDCQASYPCDPVDSVVIQILYGSTEPEKETRVIPGIKYTARIEELKRDRRAALDREDMEAVMAITQQLQDLPKEDSPDTVEHVETGRTVGEVYAAMTRTELRRALREWTVTVHANGKLEVKSPWRDA